MLQVFPLYGITNEEFESTIKKDFVPAQRERTGDGSPTGTCLLKCFRCSFCTMNQYSLDQHLQTHGKVTFSCDVCNVKFHDHKKFQTHTSALHRIEVFPCDICGTMSKSPAGLHMHKRHIHKDVVQSQRVGRSDSAVDLTNEGMYACHICDAEFTSMSSRSRHKRSMHQNKVFKCPCGAVFKWLPGLAKHGKKCSMFCYKE